MLPFDLSPTFAHTTDQDATFLSDLARELGEFGGEHPSTPAEVSSDALPAICRSSTGATS